MEMHVTVSPFSVAFETICTVGLRGDRTTLGSITVDSLANDFRGTLTGTLNVPSWVTLKGDLGSGRGGKGNFRGE